MVTSGFIAQGSAQSVSEAQVSAIADAFAASANLSASDVAVAVESAARLLQVEIVVDATLADLSEADAEAKIDGVLACANCTEVALMAGSVILTATVTVAEGEDPDEVRARLQAAFANASAASSVLGPPVEADPVITAFNETFRVTVSARVTSAGEAAHVEAQLASQMPDAPAATTFLADASIVVATLEAAPAAATATESPSPPPPLLPPLRCSLDFLSRGATGEYAFAPDGNLAAEFLFASQVSAEIKQEHTNDPFTCRLAEPTGDSSVVPNLWSSSSTSYYPTTISGREIACLDVAALSTPSVESLVAYGPETPVSAATAGQPRLLRPSNLRPAPSSPLPAPQSGTPSPLRRLGSHLRCVHRRLWGRHHVQRPRPGRRHGQRVRRRGLPPRPLPHAAVRHSELGPRGGRDGRTPHRHRRRMHAHHRWWGR